MWMRGKKEVAIDLHACPLCILCRAQLDGKEVYESIRDTHRLGGGAASTSHMTFHVCM